MDFRDFAEALLRREGTCTWIRNLVRVFVFRLHEVPKWPRVLLPCTSASCFCVDLADANEEGGHDDTWNSSGVDFGMFRRGVLFCKGLSSRLHIYGANPSQIARGDKLTFSPRERSFVVAPTQGGMRFLIPILILHSLLSKITSQSFIMSLPFDMYSEWPSLNFNLPPWAKLLSPKYFSGALKYHTVLPLSEPYSMPERSYTASCPGPKTSQSSAPQLKSLLAISFPRPIHRATHELMIRFGF
jgi:hypothetical protein